MSETSVESERVVAGDTMRITTELLKDIEQMPDRTTVVVRVKRIEVDEDGHKKLWMELVS